jgi:amidase
MAQTVFRSALELAAEIRARRIGCRELLELYLKRLEQHNPSLNAVVVLDIPRARERADAADAALARGEIWGPLHGVPITVKEAFDVAGLPTTWGILELEGQVARGNALAVDRLLAAGAVLFGKTNVAFLLADWQSSNPVYGTTNNPWDLSRTPGGSSGGAAAALAAGLSALELGSDIAASIRNPAHYCGVYGHKPTWGICPPRGHALGGNVAVDDIGVIGPLARSAEDLTAALRIIAKPDEIDGAGWRLELPLPIRARLADYRVAVLLDSPNAEVDQPVQDAIQRLADFLALRGARVSDHARPELDTREIAGLFVHLLRAATSPGLPPTAFVREVELARSLPEGDDSHRARMARGSTLLHRDWLALNERRHRMRLAWSAFFRDWDVLLCPAAASAAFPHDHEGERWQRMISINGRRVPVTDQLFWAGYSGVSYLPSTVAPIDLSPEGLPIGVQIVGPQYGDLTCIDFARHLEFSYRAFVPPSAYA